MTDNEMFVELDRNYEKTSEGAKSSSTAVTGKLAIPTPWGVTDPLAVTKTYGKSAKDAEHAASTSKGSKVIQVRNSLSFEVTSWDNEIKIHYGANFSQTCVATGSSPVYVLYQDEEGRMTVQAYGEQIRYSESVQLWSYQESKPVYHVPSHSRCKLSQLSTSE